MSCPQNDNWREQCYEDLLSEGFPPELAEEMVKAMEVEAME